VGGRYGLSYFQAPPHGKNLCNKDQSGAINLAPVSDVIYMESKTWYVPLRNWLELRLSRTRLFSDAPGRRSSDAPGLSDKRREESGVSQPGPNVESGKSSAEC
jgi:hypothetical protein